MSNAFSQPTFLSVPEAAKLCGVSRNAVYTWVRDGKLHAYQTPGKTNRIRPADLVYFMETNGMFVSPELRNAAQEDKKISPAGETHHDDIFVDSVLVVDDEASVRMVISRILQKTCRIFEAATGYEALHLLTLHKQIKVVLLDLHMPGQHGLDTFNEIKSLRPDVYVVIVTGHNLEIASDLISAEGICKVIAKPVDPPELIQITRELLKKVKDTASE